MYWSFKFAVAVYKLCFIFYKKLIHLCSICSTICLPFVLYFIVYLCNVNVKRLPSILANSIENYRRYNFLLLQ